MASHIREEALSSATDIYLSLDRSPQSGYALYKTCKAAVDRGLIPNQEELKFSVAPAYSALSWPEIIEAIELRAYRIELSYLRILDCVKLGIDHTLDGGAGRGFDSDITALPMRDLVQLGAAQANNEAASAPRKSNRMCG